MVITPAWIDAILVLVVLEFVAVGAWLAHASAGRLVLPFSLFLASGAALLLALRAALARAEAPWIALALLAALVCHLLTLWQAWRAIARGSAQANGRSAVGC
ncbi:MAG: hypothetical protein QNK04_27385 [Myxococcota bacterium]|nr:hypothetical protein [Myxococcota bacterium]